MSELRNVLQAVLMASGRALKLDELVELFDGDTPAVDRARVRSSLEQLGAELQGGALELQEVASGYRIQVRAEYATWLARLWADRPARYSRALLETLALVAYRQPVTRGEIEDIRGVSVSASIMKTLQERDWVRVLGHREVPGRPALYGTTRTFLDDFNLRGLEDLPPLAQVRDIDRFHDDLFEASTQSGSAGDDAAPQPDAEATAPQPDDAAPPLDGEVPGADAEATAPARTGTDGESSERQHD